MTRPTSALRIYAGPKALAQLRLKGLAPEDVSVIPAAAGGPKGLILGPLDRFLFGDWLARSAQPVHLVGASIGAWRMATACLPDPSRALADFESAYIGQDFVAEPGRKRPSAALISREFGLGLRRFYAGQVPQILAHPRFRLHVVTAQGRGLLRREHPVLTPLGYAGAFATNLIHRPALGAWLQRVVFSVPERLGAPPSSLPFSIEDYPTRQVRLDESNFYESVHASCSIPFVMRSVSDISGTPPGSHWDGGLCDYHLHLNYAALADQGLVLYPHFQKAVIPGWLDKRLRWRHRASGFLDTTIVLAPDPAWVSRLPRGKLPDRTDFAHYGSDLAARRRAWCEATGAAQQLADELDEWLQRPDPTRVEPL